MKKSAVVSRILPDTPIFPTTSNLEPGLVVPIPTLPLCFITSLESDNVALELSNVVLFNMCISPTPYEACLSNTNPAFTAPFEATNPDKPIPTNSFALFGWPITKGNESVDEVEYIVVLYDGLVVPIPTLVPLSNICEFPIVVAPVNLAT